MTIDDVWEEVVTTALLGTDRRDVPPMPDGAVADLVDDALAPTPALRLLTVVGALTVARRSGVTAAPPATALQPPPDDPRPPVPVAAARRWHGLAASWPQLEPEWIAVAATNGWSPGPDVVVSMLRRARRQPGLRSSVLAFGGGLAAWLVDHLPDLAPGASKGHPEPVPVAAGLASAFQHAPHDFAAGIATGLIEGDFRLAHKAVLVNAVVAMPAGHLPAVVDALTAGREHQHQRSLAGEELAAPLGLWESLIELADIRRRMLQELEPPR